MALFVYGQCVTAILTIHIIPQVVRFPTPQGMLKSDANACDFALYTHEGSVSLAVYLLHTKPIKHGWGPSSFFTIHDCFGLEYIKVVFDVFSWVQIAQASCMWSIVHDVCLPSESTVLPMSWNIHTECDWDSSSNEKGSTWKSTAPWSLELPSWDVGSVWSLALSWKSWSSWPLGPSLIHWPSRVWPPFPWHFIWVLSEVKEAAHEGATVLITELQLAGQDTRKDAKNISQQLDTISL